MHIASVDLLVADVVEDLYDTIDVCVPDVDLLVDFMFEDIVVASCDQSQRLMARHYVQFVPRSEHVDWVVEIQEILMLFSMMQCG